jgi:hypothetical protein
MARLIPEVKPGETPPAYDEILLSRPGQDVRRASPSMPWWNPRYWRKRVWAGVVVAILVILAIIIGVAVTQAKKNKYPDYTALSYSLKDTSRLLLFAYQNLYLTIVTVDGESFFDNFNYFTGYDPSKYSSDSGVHQLTQF